MRSITAPKSKWGGVALGEARLDRTATQQAPAQATGARLAETARELASSFVVHDIVLLGYLAVVTLLVALAPASVARTACLTGSLTSIAALVSACVFARSALRAPAAVRAAAYKIVLVGIVVSNYLVLRDVLPIVRADHVDAALARADAALLGVTPAIWMERLAARPVVEWFSFFYFSYFFICLGYAVAGLWIAGTRRGASEYALGTALVYCVGQLGYMVVPGYGPTKFLADEFAAPLDGGLLWSCVCSTVEAGGAQKDVFPSLHTAVPVWLTIFAWRVGRERPAFRWLAVVTGFFASQIVISTMLLRWHYAVDVVAGLALAGGVAFAVPRVLDWEARRRHVEGQIRRDAGDRPARGSGSSSGG